MIGYLAVVIAVFVKASTSEQCSNGEVRLVNGTTLQEGRLEICVNSNWSTVCDDMWGYVDARVVCRQLGYKENAGRGIHGAYFGQGVGRIALDNVTCKGMESTLLDCSHNGLFTVRNCDHSEDASVQCILREDQRVKNITLSVEVIDTQNIVLTALITWVLYETTTDTPNSFDVKCFNQHHSIAIRVSGQNSSTMLLGLLPLASYNCCVSAVYELYVADGICEVIETLESFVSQSDTTASETNIVGGVLGFIVVILFILLIISGLAVVYLSQPRWKRNVTSTRLPGSVDCGRNSSMDMPIHSNLSYIKAFSNGPSATKTTRANPSQGVTTQDSKQLEFEGGAGAEYSSIEPDYEAIDSRKESQMKIQVLVAGRLSERYEYSEAHLTTLNESVPGGSANYEIPLNLRQNVSTENEDYSRLKH